MFVVMFKIWVNHNDGASKVIKKILIIRVKVLRSV